MLKEVEFIDITIVLGDGSVVRNRTNTTYL